MAYKSAFKAHEIEDKLQIVTANGILHNLPGIGDVRNLHWHITRSHEKVSEIDK